MIPFANPKAQYLSHKEAIDQAIAGVLSSGSYVLGEEVRLFEKEFAAYIGSKRAIGVGSGTEALHLALKMCGIRSGDEVITVSNTAVATIAAIELAGAKPVFADIEPATYTMNPDHFRKIITPRTKAVIPVHLYGHPAEMDKIIAISREHGLWIIEDCAQAHGASYKGRKVGSIGDIGCFSFYPTKNLGCIGDGGAVVTDNSELAEKGRMMREYGWTEQRLSQIKGWNTRLDEIQAAVLRVKLKHLDAGNAARKHLASIYNDGLAGSKLILPTMTSGADHVYHLYVVRTEGRDRLLEFLRKEGIGAAVHYPVPVHLQPAYARMGENLIETERVAREILTLPIYPELSEKDVTSVTKAIKRYYL